jgi:hypothetical protein
MKKTYEDGLKKAIEIVLNHVCRYDCSDIDGNLTGCNSSIAGQIEDELLTRNKPKKAKKKKK